MTIILIHTLYMAVVEVSFYVQCYDPHCMQVLGTHYQNTATFNIYAVLGDACTQVNTNYSLTSRN